MDTESRYNRRPISPELSGHKRLVRSYLFIFNYIGLIPTSSIHTAIMALNFAGNNKVVNYLGPMVENIRFHLKDGSSVTIPNEGSDTLKGEVTMAVVFTMDGSVSRYNTNSGYDFKEDVQGTVVCKLLF